MDAHRLLRNKFWPSVQSWIQVGQRPVFLLFVIKRWKSKDWDTVSLESEQEGNEDQRNIGANRKDFCFSKGGRKETTEAT